MARYFVAGKDGPMAIGRYKDTPTGGVLMRATDVEWEDRPAKIATFPSKGEARRAIDRTATYARDHSYEWDIEYLRVFRVPGVR